MSNILQYFGLDGLAQQAQPFGYSPPAEADINAAMARMRAGILSPESQAYAERTGAPQPKPTHGNQPGYPAPDNVARVPSVDWKTALQQAIRANMTPGQLPPPANDPPPGAFSSLDMPKSNWPGVAYDAMPSPSVYPMTPPQVVTRPPTTLVGKEEQLQKEREGDEPQDTE